MLFKKFFRIKLASWTKIEFPIPRLRNQLHPCKNKAHNIFVPRQTQWKWNSFPCCLSPDKLWLHINNVCLVLFKLDLTWRYYTLSSSTQSYLNWPMKPNPTIFKFWNRSSGMYYKEIKIPLRWVIGLAELPRIIEGMPPPSGYDLHCGKPGRGILAKVWLERGLLAYYGWWSWWIMMIRS